MKEFDEDCKMEVDLIKIFLPKSLHEGTINIMQSCYIKGMTRSIKSMEVVLDSTKKGGEIE